VKIECNGISMHYEVMGKGSNLVLIHGAGDNLDMWYHQVPVFSQNYRVITYDIRGFGKTSGSVIDYSMSLLADDAYQLMKSIDVAEGYFLGYSMGGRIALELAINNSEMVKGLILANSSISPVTPSPENIERRQVTIELLEKGDMPRAAEMMTTSAFSPGFKSKHPEEFDRYMKVKLQNKPDNVARVMHMLGSSRVPSDVSKIQCPVLLIVGEKDFYMGVEQGKQAQGMLTNSELVILPTGHAAAIELPDKFNKEVKDFLRRVKDI